MKTPNTSHFDFQLILIFTKINFNAKMTDTKYKIPNKTR